MRTFEEIKVCMRVRTYAYALVRKLRIYAKIRTCLVIRAFKLFQTALDILVIVAKDSIPTNNLIGH